MYTEAPRGSIQEEMEGGYGRRLEQDRKKIEIKKKIL